VPFYYYGAKSKLARYYPAPKYDTIVEPFAGAAGYSLHWATPDTRVILCELNPKVAGIWRRIQGMTAEEVEGIEVPPVGTRTHEWLILAGCAGASFSGAMMRPNSNPDGYVVTSRMVKVFPHIQRRIIKALPLVRNWKILEGSYETTCPDVEATWFVDPPYQVQLDRPQGNGAGYACGSSGIDFPALGRWCRERRGQVIVCEQKGADWLPFEDLKEISTTGGGKRRTMEVFWTNADYDMSEFDRQRLRRLEQENRQMREWIKWVKENGWTKTGVAA
jgi:hypothetical protein